MPLYLVLAECWLESKNTRRISHMPCLAQCSQVVFSSLLSCWEFGSACFPSNLLNRRGHGNAACDAPPERSCWSRIAKEPQEFHLMNEERQTHCKAWQDVQDLEMKLCQYFTLKYHPFFLSPLQPRTCHTGFACPKGWQTERFHGSTPRRLRHLCLVFGW